MDLPPIDWGFRLWLDFLGLGFAAIVHDSKHLVEILHHNSVIVDLNLAGI